MGKYFYNLKLYFTFCATVRLFRSIQCEMLFYYLHFNGT